MNRRNFLAIPFLFTGLSYAKDNISSPVVIVQNAENGQIYYQKNIYKRHSIASITKLMSASVFLEYFESYPRHLVITTEDIDNIKNSSSRVPIGSMWTSYEILALALMSSDNRAAQCMARYYPGGVQSFIQRMNSKCHEMELHNTSFVDPAGLSPSNFSTALDVSRLTMFCAQNQIIRSLSVNKKWDAYRDGKILKFANTNSIVRNEDWDGELWVSKTGYIRESGRCVTMMGNIKNKPVTVVLLGSKSSQQRTDELKFIMDKIV